MSFRNIFEKASSLFDYLNVPDVKQDQKFWELEDTWFEKPCKDPEHNPPSHIMIPQGGSHRHECPSCGKIQYIKNSNYIGY